MGSTSGKSLRCFSFGENTMAKNIFYFHSINVIGGVESFFYYLAKKYHEKDIAIWYSVGDPEQIRRLRRYVPVFHWHGGQRVQCEKAFFNYATGDFIDYVDADEYIQIIHSDYKEMHVKPTHHPKITRFIAVSEKARRSFEELSRMKAEVSYLPIDTSGVKKSLHLVSATRLTAEKGRDRMIRLGRALDTAGIPYTWDIFTGDSRSFTSPNMRLRSPRLNILPEIKAADYLVQLSDSEAYCFSVAEALSMGVPVIVTPCPVFSEIGVVDRENAFVLPFDMSVIPVKEIQEGLPPFEYHPVPDRWGEILASGISSYKAVGEGDGNITVTAIRAFDTAEGRRVASGEQLIVTRDRAEKLIERGMVAL